ncbi:MAG TPA: FG-GAP-like repeat-containing protein [Solirubrobacterales bacterium]|nr:FG-GAP-like repeat-containing protein [Solirubrobacterales bacterium]
MADVKPTVVTKPASNVSEFQATLNGTINPNGSTTSYRFEYGTTPSYGESVPVPGVSAGSGTSVVSVNATAQRLEPGTTYHYRLVASNSGGTSYGADQTLHTPGWRFMRGLSSGSGVSSWSTAIGMDLPPMAVGDVNGDGKADVVSVERDNGLYRYKFGYSNGSSVPSWDPVLGGMGRPTRLAVGDLTGDGKADIVAIEPEGNSKYRYMLGTSNGAGVGSWSQVMSEMSYPHKLAVGDLSGDGKADIVSVESQANGKYRYMLGQSNGAGIGSWSQVMSEMSGPYFLNLGDLSGDGKADIVAIEPEGNSKYRYMLGTSNGAGIGSWSQVMSEMGLPVRSDLGDFTGDGKADIVSVETETTGSYNYRVGISNGAGVSNWNQIVSWMRPPRATAVGDVSGDGKADIVSVESEGNGKYRYKFGSSGASGIVSNWRGALSGMGLPNAIGVRDLTGDGKADIVAIEPEGNGKYRYMLGVSNGTGISSWSSILSGMSLPTRMRLGDFSGDGKADIVVFEPDGTGKYRIMLGKSNGAGISSWTQILGGLSYPHKLAVGDLSGDGKADIVSVESQPNGKYRYMFGKSNGAGIGSWSQVMGEMAYAEFLDLGDFNADGKADIVSVESEGSGKCRYMLGTSNGAGIGSWSQVMSGLAGPYFFHVGDLDADGKADIVSVETM